MKTLAVLIPALPLAGSIVTAILGPRVLRERSHWPIVAALVGSFLCAVMLLFDVRSEVAAAGEQGFEQIHTLWTWADVEGALPQGSDVAPGESRNFEISVALRSDPLTSIMLVMVTFVASLVAIYASGYMHGDRGYWRFFSYIGLFVFSMTMLVSVSNFVLLYVFWEAVGACSYLLIGFWYEKPEAAAAGKKAFLVNRVGDFGFALALFLIWTTFGSLNFHDTTVGGETVAGVLGQTLLASPENYTMLLAGGVGLAICLLLMLGACGKSAQFPLHVWLPDAMEGPTPVSALIHAATMVTAGVYMVTRCMPLFVASPPALQVVAGIGMFTALLAGLIALTQNDLKRVLAYSTVSQLGFMFLSLGTGTALGIFAGMFHLFTHAFFKALLFLGAGSVMHAMGGIIDVRRFGGLRKLMPITCWTFLIGCLALAGVFPFAGFFSKDQILAALHDQAHHAGEHGHEAGLAPGAFYGTLYWLALFAALLTAFYTFRAFFLAFFGAERIPEEAGHHAHESPASMTIPLCILAVCAFVFGAYFEYTHGFAYFLGYTPQLAYQGVDATNLHTKFHWDIAIAGTAAALLGIAGAAYFYLGSSRQAESLASKLRPLYLLSNGKFFVDQIYNVLFVIPLRILAHLFYWLDRWLVDGLVNLVGKVPPAVGGSLRSMQNGMVQFYAWGMVTGLLVLIWILTAWPF